MHHSRKSSSYSEKFQPEVIVIKKDTTRAALAKVIIKKYIFLIIILQRGEIVSMD